MDMEHLSETFDFSEAGLCIQSKSDRKVLFQNALSKKLCGNKTGKSCSLCKGITAQNLTQNPLKTLVSGLDILKGKAIIQETVCDLYRFSEDKKCLTILNPTQALMDVYQTHFKTLGFTKRELEVSNLLLQGHANAEIETELFISKSTLKTHLHKIYIKCPELKQLRTPEK